MFIDFIKRHKITLSFLVVAIILVTASVAGRLAKNNVPQSSATVPAVALLAVSDYRQPITVGLNNGVVESLGQADLKAQISAPVEKVGVKLGDTVVAGQVLVQLQNNDIKSQLQQAQAGLAAAKSRLDELQRGSRAEDIAISQTSYEESRTALINSIKDSYSKSDDAIHNHIDKFFTNPRESSAKFSIEINVAGADKTAFKAIDAGLADQIAMQKYELETVLDNWKNSISNLYAGSTESEIETALSLSEANLQKEIDFLNGMAPLVNGLTTDSASLKSIIDGYKAEFSAARATVSGSLASLQGAETAARSAQKALDLKLSGSSAEQIEQGKASVDQASASVDAIKATLAKTSIISPISGKVSYINGNVGEYISAGTLVASVVNPNMLRVKAYASETDLSKIQPGATVSIGKNASGIVETVAPAVDTQTKKAEINIIVTQKGDPQIVVGQNVEVAIAANKTQNQQQYLLPIESIQFSGNETFALSVGQNSTLEKIPVVTGQVIGEKIYIVSGLGENSKIVSSVRGLEAGQTVKAQ